MSYYSMILKLVHDLNVNVLCIWMQEMWTWETLWTTIRGGYSIEPVGQMPTETFLTKNSPPQSKNQDIDFEIYYPQRG